MKIDKEIKKIYSELKRKPYSEKNEWEKFLDKDRTSFKRKQKLIKEYEVSSDRMDEFLY